MRLLEQPTAPPPHARCLCAGRYQRQVGQARLLGEAYNYRLLPSRCVLDTLHLLLAAGHADVEQAARLDPASSYFRIRCAAGAQGAGRQAGFWQLALPLLSWDVQPCPTVSSPSRCPVTEQLLSSACASA